MCYIKQHDAKREKGRKTKQIQFHAVQQSRRIVKTELNYRTTEAENKLEQKKMEKTKYMNAQTKGQTKKYQPEKIHKHAIIQIYCI